MTQLNQAAYPPYDAIVVGAGFGGLYLLHKLRHELGLRVLCLERGDDVGGTWYWNQYPGAKSDSWSHMYRYSSHAFGEEWVKDSAITDWYAPQREIHDYLRSVADHFELRPLIRFGSGVRSAAFDEERSLWSVRTEAGDIFQATFFITAMGRVSVPYVPDLPGIESFAGDVLHPSRWPAGFTMEGRRVGVLGTGSTGIQIITSIAPGAEHLTVFQRTPQYVVPANNRPYTDGELHDIRANYVEKWDLARTAIHGNAVMDLAAPTAGLMKLTEEEREEFFERNWRRGNGLGFVLSIADFDVNQEANEAACAFVRAKIAEIVTDPETRRKVTPTGLWTRRPLCVDGFFEVFNQPNVTLVALRENPIVQVHPTGVETADGMTHELDALVIATGYDAGDGTLKAMNICGRGALALNDYWTGIPSSYMGLMVTNFPNMFMVGGPQAVMTHNNLVGIEATVEGVVELIGEARRRDAVTIETRREPELAWTARAAALLDESLALRDNGNFMFGGNIPGKKFGVRGWYGTVREFYALCAAERDAGYPSYQFSVLRSDVHADPAAGSGMDERQAATADT